MRLRRGFGASVLAALIALVVALAAGPASARSEGRDGDSDSAREADEKGHDEAKCDRDDRDEDGDGDAGAPGVADADGDGVCDSVDLCPDTVIPESVPTKSHNPNQWALVDDDGEFDTVGNGADRSYTIQDTAGCSCEQIVAALGLGSGHLKNGCSNGAMDGWLDHVADAGCQPDCSGAVCGDDGCCGSCGTCAAGEACVAGVCSASCTPDCAGKLCGDDGCGGSCGACAAGQLCEAGLCVDPDPCAANPNCDDGDPCTDDACVPLVGCESQPRPSGAVCDDGNVCTTDDHCVAGMCLGGVVPLCEAAACRRQICTPEAGWGFEPGPDGAACEDGDPCTAGDVCQAGTCTSGAPVLCDDGDPCTADACVGGVCTAVFDPALCPNAASCCAAHAEPGCNDVPVMDCVCQLDRSCCDDQWHPACAQTAITECGAQCAYDGPCCAVNATPGCDDPDVSACVCQMYPDCCFGSWAPHCQRAAWTQCGAGCQPDCTDDTQCDDGNDCTLDTCDAPGLCGHRPDPACAGTESCCQYHQTPGCDSPDVQSCVCGPFPECCEDAWHPHCAEIALMACGAVCPFDGPCCQENATPGCDVPEITSCVCQRNPECCFDQWSPHCVQTAFRECGAPCPPECTDDAACEDGSTCTLDVCRAPGYCVSSRDPGCFMTEPCCEAHASAGCVDRLVTGCVCERDPGCCSSSWHFNCARIAASECQADCQFAGDCCAANGTPGCDQPAVSACVCQQNPFCCMGPWSPACADIAFLQCGAACQPECAVAEDCAPSPDPCVIAVCQAPGVCAYRSNPDCFGVDSCCSYHPTPGCDDPAVSDCVCGMYPDCCDVEWMPHCAEMALGACGAVCAYDGPCCQANSSPGCEDPSVSACVCAIDAMCCTESWMPHCADIAAVECGLDCGGVCPGGLVDCGGGCVDLLRDVQNCGDCGAVCAAGQACVNGVCANAGGCQTGAECDDGDPCTVDVCDVGPGACVHMVDPTCAECAPGETRPCQQGGCSGQQSCSSSGSWGPCQAMPTPEICDGIDNDCDGVIDGPGTPCPTGTTCVGGLCQGACLTCAAANAECGAIADGCGATLDCGVCAPFEQCVGNRCLPSGGECVPGQVGPCAAGECGGRRTCGLLGVWGPCDIQPVPEVCDGVDNDCDGVIDGPGAACPTGSTCVGGVCQGQCLTCTAANAQCGVVSDGCGGMLDCGACSPFEACVGNRCVPMGGECVPGEVGTCVAGVCIGNRTCDATGTWGPCDIQPMVEICDGVDNDCDGMIDEGALCSPDAVCENGVCVVTGCVDPSQCPAGQDCVAGVCQPASAVCGDGVRDGMEACDGPDLGGATCTSLGFSGGALACDPTCRYDTSGCVAAWDCTDGILNGGETDIDCGGPCAPCVDGQGCLVATDCVSGLCLAGICGPMPGACGDAILDPGESCDDGNTAFGDGCAPNCLVEPGWVCVGQPSLCTPSPGGTISGIYDISPAVSYTCQAIFVSTVDLHYSQLRLVDDGFNLRVEPPMNLIDGCQMVGPSAQATGVFDVQCSVPGVCAETYRMTGSFQGPGVFTATLTATFSGAGCFGCTNQAFQFAGARAP